MSKNVYTEKSVTKKGESSTMERKNVWTTYGEAELKELHVINEKYKE